MKLSAELLESTLRGVKGDRVQNRATPRVPLRVKLKIVPFDRGIMGKPLEVWTRDISEGGLGIVGADAVRVGSRFIIRLPRLNETPVHLLCTVRNCVQQAVGVFVIGATFCEVSASAATQEPVAAVRPGVRAPLVAAGKSKEVELTAEIRRISDSIMA